MPETPSKQKRSERKNTGEQYYLIELEDPALPDFCSGSKMYFGTLHDIGAVIERMRESNAYETTVRAWDLFQNGQHLVNHDIAYRSVPLLTPVESIFAHSLPVGPTEWTHLNTWKFEYKMKFDAASVSQRLFLCHGTYYRCIRAEMLGLAYESLDGDWSPLGDAFWGNHQVMNVQGNEARRSIRNQLYVVEDSSESKDAAIAKMLDGNCLVFDGICEEIFATG